MGEGTDDDRAAAMTALAVIGCIVVYVLLCVMFWTWCAAAGRADDLMDKVFEEYLKDEKDGHQ